MKNHFTTKALSAICAASIAVALLFMSACGAAEDSTQKSENIFSESIGDSRNAASASDSYEMQTAWSDAALDVNRSRKASSADLSDLFGGAASKAMARLGEPESTGYISTAYDYVYHDHSLLLYSSVFSDEGTTDSNYTITEITITEKGYSLFGISVGMTQKKAETQLDKKGFSYLPLGAWYNADEGRMLVLETDTGGKVTSVSASWVELPRRAGRTEVFQLLNCTADEITESIDGLTLRTEDGSVKLQGDGIEFSGTDDNETDTGKARMTRIRITGSSYSIYGITPEDAYESRDEKCRQLGFIGGGSYEMLDIVSDVLLIGLDGEIVITK